jgi:SpoVK/Ycf46/Vps4 family AAA+-type ATPase
MSKNPEITKFVQKLDCYKLQPHLSYFDYINITNQINENFMRLTRNYNFNNKISPAPIPIYHLNALNTNQTNTIWNQYNLWQSQNDFSSEIEKIADQNKEDPLQLEMSNEPKIKVNIECNIEKIADLIDIIEKNPYENTKEYNIDIKSLHSIKEELIAINNMIGLENMKKSILDQIIYFIQGLHIGSESDFKHTAIFGPPGTGKTEIAKLIGNMYSKLGILKNNVFKKVCRNDLIAGYLGQTALKTKKVIDSCLGGVLFIDEVYSLGNNDSNNDSYSKECIDTICESLSDHKDDLMVIIAGYEEEINNCFFSMNKGLNSRFIWRFKMDEYSPKELMQIFKKKVLQNKWEFENDNVVNEKWFEKRKDDFVNYGRDMELLFSYIKIIHGRRIYGKPIELKRKLSVEDIENGYKIFLQNKKKTINYCGNLYI